MSNKIVKAVLEEHYGLLSSLAYESASSRKAAQEEDELLSRQCEAAIKLAEEGCVDPVLWREQTGLILEF